MFADMGSRGSRGSAMRPVSDRAQPPPALVTAPPAPSRPPRWFDGLSATATGCAARLALLMRFLRPRRTSAAPPPCVPADLPSGAEHPDGDASLDRGVRDIRRTDPGFDPSRFAGYAAMMFRETQSACMARDVGSVRERVTREMYDELQARCERLRSTGLANHVGQIDITTEITEAWQESGRDYVTTYVGGSILDYTIDDVSNGLLAGSKTTPRRVEEFWTFTRQAGLNFWMLSAIQTS
jgi:predicted lipid-binding transport protein (Tim44 family)